MKIMHVVGARPNFMKVAPIMECMKRQPGKFAQVLVSTGQHYDRNMSAAFLAELGMPMPDEQLDAGRETGSRQVATMMLAFEPVLARHRPDWVLVVGDVNSTLACALVAAKEGVRLAHVEAGLRSGDRKMPEELNRQMTDRIADLLLTPSEDASRNLVGEGIEPSRIRLVGNVMIDSLVRTLPTAREGAILRRLGLREGEFVLATLHRPSNVENESRLRTLLRALDSISEEMPVVFPLHPRTRRSIAEKGIPAPVHNVVFTEPLGHCDFVSLLDTARAVITDSGGVQEETTFLGVPCLTMNSITERPITISHGTNRLVPVDHASIRCAWSDVLSKPRRTEVRIPLWDGCASERIVAELSRMTS